MDKILPFFWLCGEDKQTVAEAVRKVHSYGIDAFIVESRVHGDFGGESWFEEMDTVLKTAAEENMRVWLLDDKQYPTGRANGKLEALYPEKNSWRIRLERTDVCGELKNAKIILRAELEAGEKIMGAYLARRGGEPTQIDGEGVTDVSASVEGRMLYLDVPKGEYTVYTVVKTLKNSHIPYCIDMLSAESVRVLIDEVYEKHYARYAEYFGNTFAGFFSDEPCFENGNYGFTPAAGFYENSVGRFGVAYPWSDELSVLAGLSEKDLLALWLDTGARTAEIRVAYMNAVTKLYARNFTGQLSTWCHAHGVRYMGHIVEDMGAHVHIGSSAGHYFRSMSGADLSGIDVVLHQIKPFEGRYRHYAPIAGGYADPEFFDYTLAKLAYSDARHDKNKAGNSCCEIFGAYGWGESTDEMLYLANHMLVRGINHFIPHAFFHSFGFKDCPPHFLVGDGVPLNPSRKKLFEYMTKMCRLLSDGDSEAHTAVWYNAEAEWSGAEHTSVDSVAKMLTERQIDFCFADTDTLAKAEILENGFEIAGRFYDKLIVPACKELPSYASETLSRFEKFAVYSDGSTYEGAPVHGLRVYRYTKHGERYEMLFNESTDAVTYANGGGFKYALDLLNGTYRQAGGSVAIASGEALLLRNSAEGLRCTDGLEACGSISCFDVEIKSFDRRGDGFKPYRQAVGTDFDINARGELPSFSGWVRYSFDVDFGACDGLKIKYGADSCEISFGGECFVGVGGTVICIPENKNSGVVRVSVSLLNSMSYGKYDIFSTFDAIRPCMLTEVTRVKLLAKAGEQY